MAHLFVIAGHGAGDPGACANGFSEAERVRALATRVKAIGGDNVTLGDFNMDYYQSNGIATLNIPADWQIVELHMDSGVETARGAHIVIKGGFDPDEFDTALANNLASIFPGRASKIVGRNDLQNVNVAANRGFGYRLAECGFISNLNDLTTFNNKMDEIAKAILGAFEIKGGSAPAPQPSKPQTPQPKPPVSGYNGPKLSFEYQVRAGGKVYPAVKDLNDWAGAGDGVAITDIAIKCNVGHVKYRVHVKGKDWLPWVTGYNWSDCENGYAGIGEPIDGVQIYYDTPANYAAVYGYQQAQYRVSTLEGREYYDWQYDADTHNNQDGYAGKLGVAIDKFQLF